MNNLKDVKLYQVNDLNFVAARSQKEAIAHYLEFTGLRAEQASEDPHEIIRELWDKYKFDRDSGETVTFREELARNLFDGLTLPFCFGTTEWN